MPEKNSSKKGREKVFLSEAQHHHCRWILNRQGYGVFSICGLQTRENSSFCKVHHDLVWGNRSSGADQQQRAKAVHAA
jgi:hypothetical protein